MHIDEMVSKFNLSPLADPVINAIFANAQVSGLAAESFIKAVIESDDDESNGKLNGKIISVIPQTSFTDPINRGCRVDVYVESDSNERIIFEINIYPDRTIIQRDFLAASHIFRSSSVKGDTAVQMAARMPRTVFINILTDNIRDDNSDIVQPVKVMFTKAPIRTAMPKFSIYNIQLPQVQETKPNFSNGLYCWCYTLYTAHKENKSIQEVLQMTPELASYAEREPGYLQFCQRYGLVAADPDTRHEYFLWYMNRLREEGRRITAIEMGIEQGIEQGKVLGIKQGLEQGRLVQLLSSIERKRLKAKTREQIIHELDLEENEIAILDNFESYKHLL